jgi:hypothetical protein
MCMIEKKQDHVLRRQPCLSTYISLLLKFELTQKVAERECRRWKGPCCARLRRIA